MARRANRTRIDMAGDLIRIAPRWNPRRSRPPKALRRAVRRAVAVTLSWGTTFIVNAALPRALARYVAARFCPGGPGPQRRSVGPASGSGSGGTAFGMGAPRPSGWAQIVGQRRPPASARLSLASVVLTPVVGLVRPGAPRSAARGSCSRRGRIRLVAGRRGGGIESWRPDGLRRAAFAIYFAENEQRSPRHRSSWSTLPAGFIAAAAILAACSSCAAPLPRSPCWRSDVPPDRGPSWLIVWRRPRRLASSRCRTGAGAAVVRRAPPVIFALEPVWGGHLAAVILGERMRAGYGGALRSRASSSRRSCSRRGRDPPSLYELRRI